MRHTPRFALSLLALAACGDNLPGIDDDDEEVPLGRTITGDQVMNFRLLDRQLLGELPVDLWSTVVEAHVPDGAGWQIRPGTGHRDGSFEIPGVPDGHVWLRTARRPFGDVFYWTDADHVSFDEDILGQEIPAQAEIGDQLSLAIDGLAPWQDADELAWFVPEDDVFDMNLVAPKPPSPDTTDLAGAQYDWSWRSIADVRADEPSLMVQYRATKIGGFGMRMPVRAARVDVHQRAGEDTTLTATLEEPAALPYRLIFARDVFEAQRSAIHPTRAGASTSHAAVVTALPGLVDDEIWLGSEYPLLRFVDLSELHDTTPLDLGELAIPNPFPREWLADTYVVTFPLDMPLPDGTPMTLEAVIGLRTTDLSGAARPLVTPLRAPTIGGSDAFGPLISGVGTTPEIAWSLPELGEPTSYRFQVIQAIPEPPFPYRPGWYVAAELFVPGDVTSVRIPADVLQEGSTYAVVARTFAQPGHDVRTRPHVSRGTAGFADTVFGPFTP